MATPLESSPDNPCFGCGPAHPAGLRLAFAREGDAVVSEFAVTDAMQGAPERLHSALLYLALLEACNWGAYGLVGKLGVPIRTGPFAPRRWVRVGERLALRARLAGERTVVAEATGADGAVVGSVEREYEFPEGADAFARRMGYETLPAAYAGAFGA